MSLLDGKDGDIYVWMIDNDPVFNEFMTAKDHFEGKLDWKKRLNKERQIEAARQFKFHQKFWNK